MGPFEMVIIIVLIGAGSGAFKLYLQHRESLSKKQSNFDVEELSAKYEEQKRINQGLEKRIQALETIIVHDEYELNRKFKEL